MVRLWMTEKEATTALEESTSHLDIMMGKVGHQHLKAKTISTKINVSTQTYSTLLMKYRWRVLEGY